jgi:hypothetical protein
MNLIQDHITFLIYYSIQCGTSKSKFCYDRRSVGHFVLVSSNHLGPKTRFLLLSDSGGFVDVWRPFWQDFGSVVYNCCWSSPAQSFSGPSPSRLMTTFYCLRFEIPPTLRARSPYLYPPRTGWPSYTPRHWVPFPSPTTTRGGNMVEVFEPASMRGCGAGIRKHTYISAVA